MGGRFNEIVIRPGEAGAPVEEIRGYCLGSLWFLSTQLLKYPDWDKLHDNLEVFLKRPSRRKAILLPRGHLKTTLCTISYAIQRIIRDPEIRILIANQVWDRARDILREIKAQLEGSKLKYLFGNFVSPKWNEDQIIVAQRTKALKEPTINTTGVESEQTGGHYDLIIADDLTGLQNSSTPEQREKTKRFRRSLFNLLDPGAELIEIGTRWHLDDTFADILGKEKKYYDVMVRKVVENGKVIFPKHFAKRFDKVRKDWVNAPSTCMDYIEHLKESMPLDEFSAQYLNEPFSSENQLFKPESFQYWTNKPEGLFTGMAIDLAISELNTSDNTAIVVMGMDENWKIYVLDYLKGRWRPSDIISNVFDMYNRWHPHATGMEVNGFQRTLKLACEEEMRRRRQYFSISEIKNGPERSKIDRIKTLEPFYRGGKVSHAAWMKGKDMEIELQTFPKGKHDDVIDSMSMCLPLLHPGFTTKPVFEDEWEKMKRMAESQQSFNYRGFYDHGF